MTGKEWDHQVCDWSIWVNALEYHGSSDPFGPFGSTEMACSSLLKAKNLPCSAEVDADACLGQYALLSESTFTSPLATRPINKVNI